MPHQGEVCTTRVRYIPHMYYQYRHTRLQLACPPCIGAGLSALHWSWLVRPFFFASVGSCNLHICTGVMYAVSSEWRKNLSMDVSEELSTYVEAVVGHVVGYVLVWETWERGEVGQGWVGWRSR